MPLWGKLLGAIGLLAAACVALAFIPTDEVAYAPNEPIDLTGRISVDGRPAEPLQGRMYLVGVSERKVNLLERMLLDIGDPSVDFAPAVAGRTGEGPTQADVTAMSQAKRIAAGVAFDLAGEQVRWIGISVNVTAVEPGTPAASVLRRGDVVVRINGRDVNNAIDAGRILNRLAPGAEVTMGVRRSGTARVVRMRTIAPDASDIVNRSRIGAGLATLGLKVDLPKNVTIDSGDVVGPSAGLAFALYLYDSISPKDLLRGRHVVASGTLSPDGHVLEVGRIRQKVIAAHNARRDLIVVPYANRQEARAAAQELCGGQPGCIEVVPARSIAEAVELLTLVPTDLTAQIAKI